MSGPVQVQDRSADRSLSAADLFQAQQLGTRQVVDTELTLSEFALKIPRGVLLVITDLAKHVFPAKAREALGFKS